MPRKEIRPKARLMKFFRFFVFSGDRSGGAPLIKHGNIQDTAPYTAPHMHHKHNAPDVRCTPL